MYLPERFSSLKEDYLAMLNKSTVVMKYSGKDSSRNSRLILDFDIVTMTEVELVASDILNDE